MFNWKGTPRAHTSAKASSSLFYAVQIYKRSNYMYCIWYISKTIKIVKNDCA